LLTLNLPPNTASVRVPLQLCTPDDRLDPFPGRVRNGLVASYRTGFKCPADVPAGIVLGCLLYIAWTVEHPGDELLTQRNRTDLSSLGSQGSNNIARVSGAIELWRSYDSGAI
jgi:hypothetical protein